MWNVTWLINQFGDIDDTVNVNILKWRNVSCRYNKQFFGYWFGQMFSMQIEKIQIHIGQI